MYFFTNRIPKTQINVTNNAEINEPCVFVKAVNVPTNSEITSFHANAINNANAESIAVPISFLTLFT